MRHKTEYVEAYIKALENEYAYYIQQVTDAIENHIKELNTSSTVRIKLKYDFDLIDTTDIVYLTDYIKKYRSDNNIRGRISFEKERELNAEYYEKYKEQNTAVENQDKKIKACGRVLMTVLNYYGYYPNIVYTGNIMNISISLVGMPAEIH